VAVLYSNSLVDFGSETKYDNQIVTKLKNYEVRNIFYVIHQSNNCNKGGQYFTEVQSGHKLFILLQTYMEHNVHEILRKFAVSEITVQRVFP
jgi:hypothetical protein